MEFDTELYKIALVLFITYCLGYMGSWLKKQVDLAKDKSDKKFLKRILGVYVIFIMGIVIVIIWRFASI